MRNRPLDVAVGDQRLPAITAGPADAPLVFLHLHRNERAALGAALAVAESVPARVYGFAGEPARLLTCRIDNEPVFFDPNRIFSTAGIDQTLGQHNSTVPPGAAPVLAQLAATLLRLWRLHEARAVVALHNTGDSYCVHSYAPTGEEAHNAAALHIAAHRSRHDFCIVTDPSDFAALRARDQSVILQTPEPVDDGSLSLYASRHGLRYVNIEAPYDAQGEQTATLRAVSAMLLAER